MNYLSLIGTDKKDTQWVSNLFGILLGEDAVSSGAVDAFHLILDEIDDIRTSWAGVFANFPFLGLLG